MTSQSSPKDADHAETLRLAHDLANLLGIILGNVDLALVDVGDDHPAAESLREMQEAARAARELCRQLRETKSKTAGADGDHPFSEWRPLHFILIDDEAPFRSLFDRALRRLGHEVSDFSSPNEALRAFDADPSRFDIVVTDMNMPGTNGLEIVSKFLQRAPGLCVCLTSGDVSDDLREQAAAAGIRNVVQKPNTLAEFDEAIRLLMESKKGR